jgi:hypothetical protein
MAVNEVGKESKNYRLVVGGYQKEREKENGDRNNRQ